MTGDEVQEARDLLAAIAADLDVDIARAGPVCVLSGRCCHFVEYDHVLFLSEPELEVLLAGPLPVRPLDEGASCPWQDPAGRCTAREARPLGCRVFFCDPSYQDTAPMLSEKALGRLKNWVGRRGLPWNYASLHRHLKNAQALGRFHDPDPIQTEQGFK